MATCRLYPPPELAGAGAYGGVQISIRYAEPSQA
jgi:hypothetical protein